METTAGWVYGASGRFLWGLRPLFYLASPSDSSFERVEDVPDYIERALPYFLVFIVLEATVRFLQHKPRVRVNDVISSLSAGVFEAMLGIVTGTTELALYIWVYEHCSIFDLPWDSPWTWWLAFLAVDFGYYWFHRMTHEVHFLWAAHQVHHSAEDYNIAVSLRQSAMQKLASWFIYLPLAIAVPPSAYFVHKQFNFLYNVWIHTEVFDKLGPLEWVLNTPSHHRVHHGKNPYCIDKNYAGVLMIWDRMFGTFEPERAEEKPVYGVVRPKLDSWNPLWMQVRRYVYMWEKFWEMEGMGNKLCVIIKGPSWKPGSPWRGWRDEYPPVDPDEILFDKAMPTWLNVYCIIHFGLVLYTFQELGARRNSLPYLLVFVLILFFTISLTNFGLMFNKSLVSAKVEVLRMLALLLADSYLTQQEISTGLSSVSLTMFRVVAVFSLGLWTIILARQTLTREKVP